jgi:hypothetical protein
MQLNSGWLTGLLVERIPSKFRLQAVGIHIVCASSTQEYKPNAQKWIRHPNAVSSSQTSETMTSFIHFVHFAKVVHGSGWRMPLPMPYKSTSRILDSFLANSGRPWFIIANTLMLTTCGIRLIAEHHAVALSGHICDWDVLHELRATWSMTCSNRFHDAPREWSFPHWTRYAANRLQRLTDRRSLWNFWERGYKWPDIGMSLEFEYHH